jgi:hypothetical protein
MERVTYRIGVGTRVLSNVPTFMAPLERPFTVGGPGHFLESQPVARNPGKLVVTFGSLLRKTHAS